MKNQIFISLAASFLLFGCGGGTSTSSDSKSDIVASRVGTIFVVEGMKKDVVLSSDREDTWYEFVDKENIPQGTELVKYTGKLIFRALNSVSSIEKISVIAVDDSGWKSEPLILVFETVSSNTVNRAFIKTGADDNGTGLERSFTKVENGYIRDPFGNVWENNITGELAEPKMYLLSELRCEILHQTNQNSNWRVPTVDELLNLIDYNKSVGTNMLDGTFEDINLTSWAKSKDYNQVIVSQLSGLTFDADIVDKYPVRCINAPANETPHVVSTDRTSDITHDFSTNLMWSISSNEPMKIVDAVDYCEAYDGGSGWRLPSFNEVRSIVEGDTISTLIMANSKTVVSSTPYKSSDNSVNPSVYIVNFYDNKIAYSSAPIDEYEYYITCVKKR